MIPSLAGQDKSNIFMRKKGKYTLLGAAGEQILDAEGRISFPTTSRFVNK